MVDIPDRVFEMVDSEIQRARDEYNDESSVYDRPDCPYCGRKTEIGAMGGGQIKYGCYRDDCDIKDEHSKYTYYTVEKSIIRAAEAERRLDVLKDICHWFAVEDYSG